MKKECEIEINGEKVKAIKETVEYMGFTEKTIYKFFCAGEEVGGFTLTHYRDAFYKKRIAWDFRNKVKYNRYYLEKMARLADEKIGGENGTNSL